MCSMPLVRHARHCVPMCPCEVMCFVLSRSCTRWGRGKVLVTWDRNWSSRVTKNRSFGPNRGGDAPLGMMKLPTWEHLALPATSFQTPTGGPQKLRLNPSFSQFSPCPTRCTVCASVCRFHSYCCLPVPADPVFCATISHFVPHHFPHVSACLLLQPNPLFSVA